MGKKKEEKWLQVGGFELGIERKQGERTLVCRSLSKEWSLRYGESSMMYALMMNLIKEGTENENIREYIHSLLTTFFVVTNHTHDLVRLGKEGAMPFMEGVAQLVMQEGAYEAEAYKASPEDDEEKVLKETVEQDELRQAIEGTYERLEKEETADEGE